MIGDSFEGRRMRLGLDWIWTRREVDLLADCHQYLRDGVSGWSEVPGFSRDTSQHIVSSLVTPWARHFTPYHSFPPPSLYSRPVGRSSMPARNTRLMPLAFVTRSSLSDLDSPRRHHPTLSPRFPR
jgi:hypothetical protein